MHLSVHCQTALPGGKVDAEDEDEIATAVSSAVGNRL
jgi:hypothetical protein